MISKREDCCYISFIICILLFGGLFYLMQSSPINAPLSTVCLSLESSIFCSFPCPFQKSYQSFIYPLSIHLWFPVELEFNHWFSRLLVSFSLFVTNHFHKDNSNSKVIISYEWISSLFCSIYISSPCSLLHLHF